MNAWLRDIRIGTRLAFAGGRSATLLTAIGVGLGVMMLLVAASVPHALNARDTRNAARDDTAISRPITRAGANTLLIARFDTEYAGSSIYGRIVQAEGPHAPVPPGVQALPRAGEVVVSPALADLLATDHGALLAARLHARIVGTIGNSGLTGPGELAFYLGSNALNPADAQRTDRFGSAAAPGPLAPMLVLLVVTMFVALLLPIGMFIATAVRFDGEQRERRLAALRLVGADSAMVRRIAAGEALVGASIGLLIGALGFVAARPLAEHVKLWEVTVFANDLRPSALLAVVIALTVPASAIAITLAALRHVVIEPLGVVRRAPVRTRRLLWRIAVPAVGLLLLAPLAASASGGGGADARYQVAAGATLLLIGVAALLPWVIEAVVLRLRGGSVSGQLAVRRLQLSSGTAARLVSGIAVATAGAIALQMLFAGLQNVYDTPTGQDGHTAQVEAAYAGLASQLTPAGIDARLETTPGVHTAQTLIQVPAERSGDRVTTIYVAPCKTLRTLLAPARCVPGASFVVGAGAAQPGETIRVNSSADASTAAAWTVPRSAARAEPTSGSEGVYATPGAISAALLRGRDTTTLTTVRLDPDRADAADQLRTAVARIDPLAAVSTQGVAQEDHRFAGIRRAIYIGSTATLTLIGASMLVAILESLRQRRRLLAILVAFGTRRSTLAWSVLWQTLIPVMLGLILAVGFGLALGSILLAMVDRPIRPDATSAVAICALALALVGGVTALSLPPLWRLMRPDGLRTE